MSGDQITGGQFERNEPAESETTGASVAAQSRLLGELASEIATAVSGTLRKLEPALVTDPLCTDYPRCQSEAAS